MHPHPLTRRTFLASLSAFAAQKAFAAPKLNPDWTTPFPPFQLASNLYYVGSRDLASYLIPTSQGHILLNSNLVLSPPQIRASIEKLGFKYSDLKILLISHGHYDHCAGSAQIRKDTNAQYMVMDADISVVESGGKTDFHYSHDASMYFPPTHVDRKLYDTDQIRLGETVLTAHKTAGHTKGCTTWTMKVPSSSGKILDAVIVGSPNVNPGYNLIDNPKYPQIADDFTQSFRTLKSLPCDLFLGAHGGYFDLIPKYARLQSGDKEAFLDPKGYKAYIAERQRAFEQELARQQAARPSV
jgi:metallo-beta-lactamase class B